MVDELRLSKADNTYRVPQCLHCAQTQEVGQLTQTKR